jgi:preprotein translocase subunit SecD
MKSLRVTGPRRRIAALARWVVSSVLLGGVSTLLLGAAASSAQDGGQTKDKKLANGIYGVLREGAEEKAILPLKDNEVVAVNNHRFLKKGDKEPPVYLVVRKAPDVPLVLAGEPEVVKDEKGLQIRLTLHADHAKTMERFTRDSKGGTAAVIIGGEVVTAHKIRDVITGGAVQITNCNEEAGAFLLKQLQDLSKKK